MLRGILASIGASFLASLILRLLHLDEQRRQTAFLESIDRKLTKNTHHEL